MSCLMSCLAGQIGLPQCHKVNKSVLDSRVVAPVFNSYPLLRVRLTTNDRFILHIRAFGLQLDGFVGKSGIEYRLLRPGQNWCWGLH